MEAVRERLAGMQFRGAVVGPMGSGKTTLMEDLAQWVQARGYRAIQIRLSLQERRIPPLPVDIGCKDVVFLDGADLMGFFRWKWLKWKTRKAGGLVIAAHKSGLMPTLIECQTTVGVLREIAMRLKAPVWMMEQEVIGKLYEKHGGNIRESLREMYDWCAGAEVKANQEL